jgi:hypothetical protein
MLTSFRIPTTMMKGGQSTPTTVFGSMSVGIFSAMPNKNPVAAAVHDHRWPIGSSRRIGMVVYDDASEREIVVI